MTTQNEALDGQDCKGLKALVVNSLTTFRILYRYCEYSGSKIILWTVPCMNPLVVLVPPVCVCVCVCVMRKDKWPAFPSELMRLVYLLKQSTCWTPILAEEMYVSYSNVFLTFITFMYMYAW